jgi:hypothetical protein
VGRDVDVDADIIGDVVLVPTTIGYFALKRRPA